MEWTSNYATLHQTLHFLCKLQMKISNAEYQMYAMHSKRLSENYETQKQNDEELAEQLMISIQDEINAFMLSLIHI